MKYIGVLLCLPLTIVMMVPAQAQTSRYIASAPAASSSDFDSNQPGSIVTIQKRVNEVNVLFIAMNKHGKFVRDLSKSDFSILDDHKPPQAIVNFIQQTDLPLQMGLLVDTSGSVHGRFQFEQDAAVGFLQHTIRPHYDHAFVMGFNARNHVSQDFTDNVSLLSAGVQHLEDGGGTALFDAIYSACKERLLKDERYAKRSDLYATLGGCEFEQGKYRESRQSFETATKIDPAAAGLWLGLGKAALQLGDLRRAELALKKAIAIDPAASETNLLLGYLRCGELRHRALAAQGGNDIPERGRRMDEGPAP